MPKVRITEAAEMLGVTPDTLRRWEEDGVLLPERTGGGHRRYDVEQIRRFSERSRAAAAGSTVCYARVSGAHRGQDLQHQVRSLEAFCANRGWQHEIITDFGSGLDFGRPGLKRLMQAICSGDCRRLVVLTQDRLAAIGSDLVLMLCTEMNCEPIIINQGENCDFPEAHPEDVLQDLLRVFGIPSRTEPHSAAEIARLIRQAIAVRP